MTDSEERFSGNGDDWSLIERQLFRSDSNWRTIWIADAHRGNGDRLIVRADEKLMAFVELESAMAALVKIGVDNQEEKEEQHVESCGDR